MPVLSSSTFLDFVGNGLATPQQFATLASATGLSEDQQIALAQQVLGTLIPPPGQTATAYLSGGTITVGLTLERVNDDPVALLSGDWATRQAALADQNAVWAEYGTSATAYAQTQDALAQLFGLQTITPLLAADHLSSAKDRTIWLSLSADQFQTLFGTPLLDIGNDSTFYTHAWAGNLDLADTIPNIDGIWFELDNLPENPAVANPVGTSYAEGPIGVGNASTRLTVATPSAIARNYNFPLPESAATPAIALVEDPFDRDSLFTALNEYRTALNHGTMSQDQFIAVLGSHPDAPAYGELTLDVSVLADAAPRSTQYLYAPASGTIFNTYQQIFFDDTYDPGILSSSYGMSVQFTAGSPFQVAWENLFIDGALSNVSVNLAAGDQGSAAFQGNGVANYWASQSPTYALAVGGTSIASRDAAGYDSTLTSLLDKALNDDPTTVFQLVAAGLRTLPSDLPDVAPTDFPARHLETLFESVWQSLEFTPYEDGLAAWFGENETTTGGVNTALPIPDYQLDFGLVPTGSSGIGRGAPDVAALSAGDALYGVLDANYVNDPTDPDYSLFHGDGGTSAASPLWAALTAHLNAIFLDQHLPRLGYFNDLLYMAAAVAPASFNDTRLGSNTSSYYLSVDPTGYYRVSGPDENIYTPMVPTGDGYAAVPGYDLATGLGTPNGMVLARTLTAIAQAQTHAGAAGVVEVTGPYAATSTVDQTLLVQSTFATSIAVEVNGVTSSLGAAEALAWTGRLAGQSVQGDRFDAVLVTLFDGAAKAMPFQISAGQGNSLGLEVNGALQPLYQSGYTSAHGFVQYGDATEMVTLARPGASARTGRGEDHQEAILRLRQNGTDALELEVYRADDLNGAIGNLQPGQAGYAEAAALRLYRTDGDATKIDGPGYGNYAQARLVDVSHDDILAMKLTNRSTGDVYWAFSQANQSPGDAGVTHLYSYGMNLWGWEDQSGGGDLDYNDLIVGIDFTSASAQHDWLV